tara:strand:+ start:949 stop:1695 length:747 start_codon:yes stop_codon:yes gene_type:complete
MAPIKFDENIKEKLDARRIKPSSQAWERIEQELEMPVKRSTNRKIIGWIALAACFAGILIIAGSLFFRTENSNEPALVETSKELKETAPIQREKENDLPEIENKKELLVQEELKPKPTQFVEPQQEILQNSETEQKLADANQKEEVIEENTDFKKSIDKKIDELVAQVDSIESKNKSVTDAEIDALLAQAQKQVITERIFNEKTKRVDANALLMDVEAELDRPLQEKVFEALKDGFLKAREAIADRNN